MTKNKLVTHVPEPSPPPHLAFCCLPGRWEMITNHKYTFKLYNASYTYRPCHAMARALFSPFFDLFLDFFPFFAQRFSFTHTISARKKSLVFLVSSPLRRFFICRFCFYLSKRNLGALFVHRGATTHESRANGRARTATLGEVNGPGWWNSHNVCL